MVLIISRRDEINPLERNFSWSHVKRPNNNTEYLQKRSALNMNREFWELFVFSFQAVESFRIDLHKAQTCENTKDLVWLGIMGSSSQNIYVEVRSNN